MSDRGPLAPRARPGVRPGLAVAMALTASPVGLASADETNPPVFVPAPEVERLFRREGARILDARGSAAEAPFLPSAVVTSWTDVRAGLLRDGRLTDLEAARAHYASKGVRLDRPVVVYGAAASGWGEEGRIWWDLRVLGHPRVYILDGGVEAWVDNGGRTASVPSGPLPGALPSAPTSTVGLRVDHLGVLEVRAAGGVLVDTRTEEEYRGGTPYLSARGGHIPGAVRLGWRSLLDDRGRLLDRAELRSRLSAIGVRPGRPVAAYCTGGVRSAFVVAVLAHLGLPAANYDGSWWDWAAREELAVEGGP